MTHAGHNHDVRVPGESREARPLTAASAFVLHLTVTADDSPDAVVGRVEHVASGSSLRFASTAELIDFLHQHIRR